MNRRARMATLGLVYYGGCVVAEHSPPVADPSWSHSALVAFLICGGSWVAVFVVLQAVAWALAGKP